MERTKFILDEKDLPKQWYNIQPDLPEPLPPPLHPGTGKPVGPADLAAVFPMELIKQEASQERWIGIPEEIQQVYKLWRPTPLYRAYRLEKALGTPAKIFYKNEAVSPAGSHKPNTAVAQAYYNKKEGVKRLTTETGAGQWGSALALACTLFDLECKVYMVAASYHQKPYRRIMMETWRAKVTASPSEETKAGRDVRAKLGADCPGSLGIAISEAVEDAVTHPGTKYSLGSVLNHVLLHQTVIGQEIKKQLEMAGAYPDMVIGCIGGGSSFGGMVLPFVKDKLSGKKTRFIAVEPQAAPSITKGTYTYDFGDMSGMTPLLKMYTLGHTFVPPPVHAGGLRYHGKAPIVSHLARLGIIETRAEYQIPVFKAAVTFAQTEGIVPAPEPSHAIKVAIDEALKCKESGEKKNILFLLCGHGHFDMAAYDAYLSGKLEDYEYPAEKVKEALASLPKVPGA